MYVHNRPNLIVVSILAHRKKGNNNVLGKISLAISFIYNN
jgi:hypothetical protein